MCVCARIRSARGVRLAGFVPDELPRRALRGESHHRPTRIDGQRLRFIDLLVRYTCGGLENRAAHLCGSARGFMDCSRPGADSPD
jgi:hypothetical protein